MARLSAYVLVIAVVALAALGLMMLASTTFYLEGGAGETYSTLYRQVAWLVLGILTAIGLVIVGYERLYSYRWWIFGVVCFLLILCYIPFFGVEVNGATRWISLKGFGLRSVQFQPSAMAKLACAIVIAAWFHKYREHAREFKMGFVYPLGFIGVLVLLIAGEVDLGTAALIGAVGIGLMFVAGTRWPYLFAIVGTGLAGLALAIRMIPNRVERIIAFTDLEKYKDGLGLQQWRSLIAFGSGGESGVGLGNGRQKMLYLPEAHTDFIFPMVGEELGFLGTSLVVGLFVLIILSGFIIAYHAPNQFSCLLAFGITFTFALEALINMGVTTALLPNKGLALPFVSNGGSGLLMSMASIGVLLSIYRRRKSPQKNDLMAMIRRRI